MRELNVLDASNNIDVQAMKRDIQKYTMPSEWFKNKYEHLLDTCYRFTNTMINKGDDYEHINDMATMFARMMHQMQKDNYRSSSDYKNPMGRMSQFKNMFNSMR